MREEREDFSESSRARTTALNFWNGLELCFRNLESTNHCMDPVCGREPSETAIVDLNEKARKEKEEDVKKEKWKT